MNTTSLYPVQTEDASSKILLNSRLDSLQEVLSEQRRWERDTENQHPWVPIIRNWLIALSLIILVICGIVEGINSTIEKKATEKTNVAMEAKAAEEQAAADAAAKAAEEAKKTEEALFNLMKEDCAKCLYGIRNFIEKYHYSALDEKTYLRAAFNRADVILQQMERDGIEITAEVRQQVLHDVLFKPEQFLACRESNPVLADYEKVSKEALNEWISETSKPCDISYQFADTLENGVWLKTSLNADGFAIRWRYT